MSASVTLYGFGFLPLSVYVAPPLFDTHTLALCPSRSLLTFDSSPLLPPRLPLPPYPRSSPPHLPELVQQRSMIVHWPVDEALLRLHRCCPLDKTRIRATTGSPTALTVAASSTMRPTPTPTSAAAQHQQYDNDYHHHHPIPRAHPRHHYYHYATTAITTTKHYLLHTYILATEDNRRGSPEPPLERDARALTLLRRNVPNGLAMGTPIGPNRRASTGM